jgi:hypothetical protein
MEERAVGGQSKIGTILLAILSIVLALGWYWSWRNETVSAAPLMCMPQNLSIKMGSSEGAAGTIYRHVVVTNKTTQNCTISGYGTVFLMNTSNTVLGQGASPTTLYPPAKVTLAPKAHAHVVIGLPNAGNFDDGVCTAVSAKLRMYIPSATTPLDVPFASANCPGFSVTAFKAGS